ncbi:winged helix-turn-helix domain-containing protein [Paucibacter sp. R3-3]|uniref:Winged helix-turn-helix domain-containing protein n=1 Tax=Roseateles agri TaxID=3098619 RepID=A0ABU5DMR7_9BURK|nr:winged helix-turn-helix domain-containing protein [Paucibacter sp. R3-3]MDY0746352.1 winged helix-turn-helix domain-containing protein [Paucibacter sp. R3-3]
MPSASPSIHGRAFGFGPFSLYVSQKLLLAGGQPVRLGSRAFDLLVSLIERAGEVVTKDELAAIVWPRTIVEESSLRVHVAALRKALGDGQGGTRYIVNKPGRGYSFVAPVRRLSSWFEAPPAAKADARFGRLPAQVTRMIGRAESVALLAAQLNFGRFVTLVGPGGIGKTTMALAVAESRAASFEDGVCYLDFAPIVDGQMVPALIAAGLRLPGRDEVLSSIQNFLRERRLLIVLDNCEHLIEPLATLAEQLLSSGPGVHLLATSREPMRAEGEWLHRVGALALPPEGLVPSAAEALRYPAIELFVERATASVDDFVLADGDAEQVGDLCRRLDGNPLAIELAAARVDLFGLSGLTAQLDAHLLDLRGGRRDVPSRHHSLTTMLDWSYRLLSDTERLVLTRLGLFRGWFPLRAAIDFVLFSEPAGSVDETQVRDAVADLAAKSLLTIDTSGEVVQFRLLELTRAFAIAQLDLLGERARLDHCHASHVRRLVDQAAQDWTTLAKPAWFAAHLWLIVETRAALAWCFSADGDPLTGCRLTARLWGIINSINPFDRPDAVERALEALSALPERHPELEVRLNIALAIKQDTRAGIANAASARAVELAASFEDPSFEAEALMAVVTVEMSLGQYQEALHTQERLAAAAQRSGQPVLALVADRIGAQASHLAGVNGRCRLLAERVLSHPLPRGTMGTIGGGLDHRVSMGIMLARTLWIEGMADQAWLMAEDTFQIASNDDPLAQMQVLSLCLCPLALWRGDEAEARPRIDALRALTLSQASDGVWLPSTAQIPWWLPEPAAQSQGPVPSALQRDHLMTAYRGWLTSATVSRAETDAADWCTAEILRAWGEQLLGDDAPDTVDIAQRLFVRAMETAARQQAPAWELRAANSLARLLKERLGRGAEARAVLEPVYRRFTEGFATADLRQAAALLAS